ncbi:MAG TPA: hypothetical protein VGC89_08435 [Pyrinomonadaceae bacterium]|jgi:hypothetical protein
MTKRQQLFDAVVARFAQILTSNTYVNQARATVNYATNIGQNVYEWQLTAIEKESLPCVILRDEIEQAEIDNELSGSYTRKLEITAEAVLAEASATAAQAREALGDIIAAIREDQRWGNLAVRSLPVSDEIIVDDASDRIGGARLKFIIVYNREPWGA